MNWADAIRAVTHALAVPYGYTLTIWASGALAVSRYGSPRPLEIFLFIGGATLGFLAFDAVSIASIPKAASFSVVLPASVTLNLLAVVPASLVVLLVRRVRPRALGFFAVGFAGSAAYLATVVALLVLVGTRG